MGPDAACAGTGGAAAAVGQLVAAASEASAASWAQAPPGLSPCTRALLALQQHLERPLHRVRVHWTAPS